MKVEVIGPWFAAPPTGEDGACEATLLDPDPRWTERHGHLTGEMAGKMAAEAEVGRLVLTHLGPDAGINAGNLERAGAACSVPVELAEAGAVYDL